MVLPQWAREFHFFSCCNVITGTEHIIFFAKLGNIFQSVSAFSFIYLSDGSFQIEILIQTKPSPFERITKIEKKFQRIVHHITQVELMHSFICCSHGLRTGIFEASKLVLINVAPTLPEIQVIFLTLIICLLIFLFSVVSSSSYVHAITRGLGVNAWYHWVSKIKLPVMTVKNCLSIWRLWPKTVCLHPSDCHLMKSTIQISLIESLLFNAGYALLY